jgi:EmrB/QacA subfamily drug resistance transporter
MSSHATTRPTRPDRPARPGVEFRAPGGRTVGLRGRLGRAERATAPVQSNTVVQRAAVTESGPAGQSGSTAPAGQPGGARGGRLGLTLAIVLCAQLMIILDATVVNIALPGISHGLHLSAAGLSWVLNAYSLTFGGLLLLGGRAGDILGRRRVFLWGIALFTLASLGGGLAVTAPELLAARALQGVGAALATPATLATIVASVPEGRARTRALALFTAVITGGASLGLVLGGMITQWASWRWVFFVNIPVGAAVLLAGRFLPESVRRPGRFDVAGAVFSTGGVAALVYAFFRAASAGWGDPLTLATFGAAAILITAFALTEARTRQPVTPLRLFADRTRAASYVARVLVVGAMFGTFFFLSQFIQDVLGFSPVKTGLAFLPMTVMLFAVSRLAPRLMTRFGPKQLMLAGLAPAVGGLALLGQITPATTYWPGVLGPMLLMGFGMGLAFVPLTAASLAGVAPEDSGAASAMVNVTQQVGGALGLAALVTVYGRSAHAGPHHVATATSSLAQQAFSHGVAASFATAAIFDTIAILVILIAVRLRAATATAAAVRQPAPAPAPARSELMS